MTGQRPDHFDEVFTPAVRDMLVGALRRAYESARELHDPTRGSNEVTFGVGLYHHAVFELDEVARAEGSTLEVVGKVPFRVLAGSRFRVGCHRVGRSASDSIWSSFPENTAAAVTMIEQPYLPGLAPDVANARNLILAHMGNVDDSLGAVYLCVPTREENDRIRGWGFAELIWRAESVSVPAGAAPDRAPDEVIETGPLVRRKPNTKVERE